MKLWLLNASVFGLLVTGCGEKPKLEKDTVLEVNRPEPTNITEGVTSNTNTPAAKKP
jgi:hypothetical protein